MNWAELKSDLDCFDCREDAIHLIKTYYWQFMHDELIEWMDCNLPYGNDYDPTP